MYGLMTGRKVRAICPDGRVRTATFTSEPDTFFSVPARVHARGLTVSGFVSVKDDNDPPEWPEHIFWPFAYLKNGRRAFGDVHLPRWSDRCADCSFLRVNHETADGWALITSHAFIRSVA